MILVYHYSTGSIQGYYRNRDMLECTKAPPGYYVTSNANATQGVGLIVYHALFEVRRHSNSLVTSHHPSTKCAQAASRRLLEETKHLPARRRALLYAIDRLSRALQEEVGGDSIFQLAVSVRYGLGLCYDLHLHLISYHPLARFYLIPSECPVFGNL
jgi:hypothetical protein